MDQVKKIPKILSSVSDIKRSDNKYNQVSQLKKEVHQFIDDIKVEFSNMVNKYQRQINELKANSRLHNRSLSQTHSENKSQHNMSKNIFTKEFNENIDSPHRQSLKSKIRFNQTAATQFYQTKSNMLQPFPSCGSAFEIKNRNPSKFITKKSNQYFPIQLINPQHDNNFQRSRYQRKSSSKRQKQQEILLFLHLKTENLQKTTEEVKVLLGKKSNQQEQLQLQVNQQLQTSHAKSRDEQLNQSLSQICDSLDTSFVSQKARKSSQKKKRHEDQHKQKLKQRQQKNDKMKKQRALKNLLLRLRQNGNSSNPPEVIKTSKLIPTGQKGSTVFNGQQVKSTRKNSKVLINPTAVQVQKNFENHRHNSPSSPQRRPPSILKQSSNILTRSISGISAISFQC